MPFDPYRVLTVPRTASDVQIREAYLARVRECPPDRDPEAFEEVRQAYEAVMSLERRIETELFDTTPPAPADLFVVLSPPAPRPLSFDRLRILLRGNP